MRACFVSLALCLGTAAVIPLGCSSAKTAYNRIVDGYWQDVDGLVVETKGDEMVVTDFGSSPLGTAPTVFRVGAPYVTSLAQVSSTEFTGKVVNGNVANGVLQSVEYEDAKIVSFDETRLIMTTSTREIVLQRASGPTSAGTPGPAVSSDGGSTPTKGPLPVCDGTEGEKQVQGTATFTLTGAPRHNGTYKDAQAISGPHKTSTGCVYRFEAFTFGADAGGNVPSITVDFARRPIANRTYTTPNDLGPIGLGGVYCSGVTPSGSNWEAGTGGSLTVEVVGETITLTLKDILCTDSYNRDIKPVFNGTITGG